MIDNVNPAAVQRGGGHGRDQQAAAAARTAAVPDHHHPSQPHLLTTSVAGDGRVGTENREC